MAEKSESIESIKDNEIVTNSLYECLKCEHREKVRGSKKGYSEIRICPKCQGAFIDVYKIGQFKEASRKVGKQAEKTGKTIAKSLVKIDLDVSKALKGLKAVQREAKKTGRALREVEGLSRFSDDDLIEELGKRGWNISTATLWADDSEEPEIKDMKLKKETDTNASNHRN